MSVIEFRYNGKTYIVPLELNAPGAIIDVDEYGKIEKELESATATVKRLEEEARWIPVREGLPEEDVYVNLCNINYSDGEKEFGKLVRTTTLPSGRTLTEWKLKRGGVTHLISYTHYRPIDLPEGE